MTDETCGAHYRSHAPNSTLRSEAEEPWLPLDQVMAAVHEAGEEVSLPQLDRWQRYGLLPERRQWHRPGQMGSASGYPKPAVAHITMLARLRRQYHRLSDLAFAAWLTGLPLAPATVRSILSSILAKETALPKWAEALRHAPETAESITPFDAAEGIVSRHPSVTWHEIDLPSRADRETVVIRILEWWLGGMPLWAGSGGEGAVGLGEATPQELLWQAMGLERSVLARYVQATPNRMAAAFEWWRQSGIGPMDELPTFVATWTDAEITQVQEDMVAWSAAWRSIALIFPSDHGDPLLNEFQSGNKPSLGEAALLACGFVLARRSDKGAMLNAVLSKSHYLESIAAAVASLPLQEREQVQAAVWAQFSAGQTL